MFRKNIKKTEKKFSEHEKSAVPDRKPRPGMMRMPPPDQTTKNPAPIFVKSSMNVG